MIKITDVAKKANVSISTVSKVINNKPGISQKLRKKVLDACEELDYKPNFYASRLSGKKTNVIGFIHNDEPSFDLFKSGLYLTQACLLQAAILGYDSYSCIYDDIKKIESIISFGKTPIDGAILTLPRDSGLIEDIFKKEHIPIVAIGSSKSDIVPCVDADNIDLVKKISSKLIEAYGKDIYLLNSKNGTTIASDRYDAFLDICKKNDIIADEHHFYLENKDEILTNKFILSKIKKDTSFITADEDIARNLYKVIIDKKLSIGDDVGVFSLGVQDEFIPLIPKLSYAQQDYVSIGKQAVSLLIEHINGNTKTKKILIASNISLSESTSRLFKK